MNEKMTAEHFRQMKSREKIAVLTAYDYLTAQLLDEVGIDAILVGDSVGMVFSGHETTLPVTMEAVSEKNKIKLGQPMKIKIDETKTSHQGKIYKISGIIDPGSRT